MSIMLWVRFAHILYFIIIFKVYWTLCLYSGILRTYGGFEYSSVMGMLNVEDGHLYKIRLVYICGAVCDIKLFRFKMEWMERTKKKPQKSYLNVSSTI